MNGCQNSCRSAARRLHGRLASLIIDSVDLLSWVERCSSAPQPTDQHRDPLVMGVRRRSDSAGTLDGYRDTHWLA